MHDGLDAEKVIKSLKEADFYLNVEPFKTAELARLARALDFLLIAVKELAADAIAHREAWNAVFPAIDKALEDFEQGRKEGNDD